MVGWIVGASVLGIGVVISVLASWIAPPVRTRTRVVVAALVLLVLAAGALERVRATLDPDSGATTSGALPPPASTARTPQPATVVPGTLTSDAPAPSTVVDEPPEVLYLSSVRNVVFENSVGLALAGHGRCDLIYGDVALVR
jgi:hypothetical protein